MSTVVLTGCLTTGVRVAKLCDLGLAKTWEGRRGHQSTHIGSESYWAPVRVLLIDYRRSKLKYSRKLETVKP